MSATGLLAELELAGVRIIREGEILRVRGAPGVRLGPYRARLAEHKPALIAALAPLDAEIIGSEANRRSCEEIAQRIARIEGRIGTPDELPGDWLALRYWRAIEDLKPESGRDA
jgi:hypothetical protein